MPPSERPCPFRQLGRTGLAWHPLHGSEQLLVARVSYSTGIRGVSFSHVPRFWEDTSVAILPPSNDVRVCYGGRRLSVLSLLAYYLLMIQPPRATAPNLRLALLLITWRWRIVLCGSSRTRSVGIQHSVFFVLSLLFSILPHILPLLGLSSEWLPRTPLLVLFAAETGRSFLDFCLLRVFGFFA